MSNQRWAKARANQARQWIGADGYREHSVALRSERRAGKNALLGRPGTPTGAPPDLPLTPPPLVTIVDLNLMPYGPGVLEAGDVLLTGIQRDPRTDALLRNPQTLFVIAGPSVEGLFSIVGGTLQIYSSGWEAVVRKAPAKA